MSPLRLGLIILLCAACRLLPVDPEVSRSGGRRTGDDDLIVVGRGRVSAVYDVEVVPPHAYALERGILRVLEVHDPQSVHEVASLELPRAHVRMALRHPYLYLTGFGSPLTIVDISDPSAPRSVLRFEPAGRVLAALFRDTIAVLAGTPQMYEASAPMVGWLSVIRIIEGEQFRLAELTLPRSVVDLVRVSAFVVAVHPEGSVTVIDLEDPVRPRVVGTTGGDVGDEPAQESIMTRRSRAVVGPGERMSYVATVSVDTGDGARLSLSSIAIDASGKTAILGNLDLGPADWPAPVVAVRGDCLLIGVDQRLVTVDAGDPSQPVVLADRRLAASVEGLAVAGEHVFIGSGEDGLWIFRLPPELARR